MPIKIKLENEDHLRHQLRKYESQMVDESRKLQGKRVEGEGFFDKKVYQPSPIYAISGKTRMQVAAESAMELRKQLNHPLVKALSEALNAPTKKKK